MNTEHKSVAFHTLGCKLNFSETSTLSRILEQEGFEKRNFDEVADVYVINTCSVTDNADKECRSIVRKIQRQAPESFIVVTGCYAQLKPQEIAEMDGVDLVLGAAEKFNIARHLADLTKSHGVGVISSCEIEDVHGFHGSYSLNDRTRTFLKVQDGCDYNCSFCTIPLARGRSRSNTKEGVMRQIAELQTHDIKEVILTGVNLGDFGRGNDGGKVKAGDFFELIQEIDSKSTIPRFRISSIEPNLLSDEIIDFVGDSKRFMPHFHIPLQSGSDYILGKMRRRYKTDLYRDRVAHIKRRMPHACIGVDIIVGFPGETDSDFEETLTFVRDLDVSYFHVFTYSERPNTPAIEMDENVPKMIRHQRNKILRNLSFRKMHQFTEQQSDTIRPVLFESEQNGWIEGYTDNYIRVKTAFKPELANTIVNWNL